MSRVCYVCDVLCYATVVSTYYAEVPVIAAGSEPVARFCRKRESGRIGTVPGQNCGTSFEFSKALSNGAISNAGSFRCVHMDRIVAAAWIFGAGPRPGN